MIVQQYFDDPDGFMRSYARRCVDYNQDPDYAFCLQTPVYGLEWADKWKIYEEWAPVMTWNDFCQLWMAKTGAHPTDDGMSRAEYNAEYDRQYRDRWALLNDLGLREPEEYWR